MKVAISTKTTNPETDLDVHLGRCPYFFIFDLTTGSYTVIENTAAHAPGGAGSAAAKLLSENDVSIIISGNYGPHAVTALKNLEIRMYLSSEEKLWTVLDKFKQNLLAEAQSATVKGKH